MNEKIYQLGYTNESVPRRHVIGPVEAPDREYIEAQIGYGVSPDAAEYADEFHNDNLELNTDYTIISGTLDELLEEGRRLMNKQFTFEIQTGKLIVEAVEWML